MPDKWKPQLQGVDRLLPGLVSKDKHVGVTHSQAFTRGSSRLMAPQEAESQGITVARLSITELLDKVQPGRPAEGIWSLLTSKKTVDLAR